MTKNHEMPKWAAKVDAIFQIVIASAVVGLAILVIVGVAWIIMLPVPVSVWINDDEAIQMEISPISAITGEIKVSSIDPEKQVIIEVLGSIQRYYWNDKDQILNVTRAEVEKMIADHQEKGGE